MDLLKERIIRDGRVYPGNILKVDSFLNHLVDVSLLCEIGKEFYRLFGCCNITKILTIEASGIGVACIAAQYFDVPVLFAKKTQTLNIGGDVYSERVESYTHKKTYDIVISKQFLKESDRVLLIDDFLALGNALRGLVNLALKAGSEIAGAGIVIEKSFQSGGQNIRDMGIRVESLARVCGMTNDTVFFED